VIAAIAWTADRVAAVVAGVALIVLIRRYFFRGRRSSP
jgi:hypothetical protein